MRPFQVSLCGKKGLLCDKLCDFILANLILFYQVLEEHDSFFAVQEAIRAHRNDGNS